MNLDPFTDPVARTWLADNQVEAFGAKIQNPSEGIKLEFSPWPQLL